MATTTQSNTEACLANLPEELCVAIIDEMDIPSIMALSQTSRFFNRLSDPHAACHREKLKAFLVEAQGFSRWQDGFACFSCMQVLPRDCFGKQQTKRPRGRGGHQQHKRFCIDCGMKNGRFEPGQKIFQAGVLRIVCSCCKGLKDIRKDITSGDAYCKDCYAQDCECVFGPTWCSIWKN